MITIIDYGCGNLHSLKYALASIGLDSQVSCCEAETTWIIGGDFTRCGSVWCSYGKHPIRSIGSNNT